MWSKRIVEAPPAFHDDAGFGEGVENPAIEKLVAEAGVEALDVSIFPRAPRLDGGGLCAGGGDPVLNRLCNVTGRLLPRTSGLDASDDVWVFHEVFKEVVPGVF